MGYIKVSHHQQQEKKQALKVISLMLDCEAHEFEQIEIAAEAGSDSKWSLGNFLSKPIVPSSTHTSNKLATDMSPDVNSAPRSFTELLMQYVDRD